MRYLSRVSLLPEDKLASLQKGFSLNLLSFLSSASSPPRQKSSLRASMAIRQGRRLFKLIIPTRESRALRLCMGSSCSRTV